MDVPAFFLRMETALDQHGEATPQRFHLGARCVEVHAVLDRWLAEDHSYFKLRDADGALYLVRRDNGGDHWELTQFLAPRR